MVDHNIKYKDGLIVPEHSELSDSIRKRFIFGIIALLSLYIISIIAYNRIEKWDIIDSIYFATATMTTVGYGDVHPQTQAGKIFTVIYLWCSVGLAIYFLYSVIAPIIYIFQLRFESRFSKSINRFRDKAY